MNKKILYICIIGAPNSGKSTLLNTIVNQKISIASYKPHTTRNNIKGIITKNNTQLIFIDTPGYLKKAKYQIEKSITKQCLKEIKNIDFICIVIDISKEHCLKNPLINIIQIKSNKKIILIFNKIDLIKEKKILLHMAQIAKNKGFDNIFMISAINNKNVQSLLNYLLNNSFEENWYYKPNKFTNKTTKELAEDMTMEQIYKILKKEIPYNIKINTELWREEKKHILIHQTIKIKKQNQKIIILGKKGCNIKKISIQSKKQIEILSNKKIHLYLFIKIKEKYMNNIS